VDLSKTMTCPECGNVVVVTDQFCSKCFARLERPGLWRKVLSVFRSAAQPGPHILTLKRTETLKTMDRHGERHGYRSLDEVPPELRAQFEKLQSDVLKEADAALSRTGTSRTGDAVTPGIISKRTVSMFKVKDASGNERIYHSLDELPPEIQEAVRRAQGLGRVTTWQGKAVSVRARYIPRFLWTTASIDVFLDERCVFRSGGQLKSTGSHSASFDDGGSEHRMELTWGRSREFRFPYQLRIDGVLVGESQVRVENQILVLIPALIIVALMALVVFALKLIFQGALRHIVGG
jgi:hypothetical protein